MKKRNRRRSLTAAGILCAATFGLVPTVRAVVVDDFYTFGGSSGTWTIASAWGGGVPAGLLMLNTTNAILPFTHVGSYTVSFGTQVYSTALPLNTIHISAATGATADLVQNNAASAMAAIEEHLGLDGGTGQYDQSAGTNTVTSTPAQLGLQVGENFPGIYNLSGGTLTVPNSQEMIGNNSAGTFTQNGGVNSASYMVLGYLGAGSGTYSLNTGSLTVTGGNSQNLTVGYSGTATFLQTGGSNTVMNTGLVIAANPGSNGTYSLSGVGSLTVNGFEYIGENGAGTFAQNGGANSATYMIVGGIASSGFYSLAAGSLTINATSAQYNLAEYLTVGFGGTGTFLQTGGSNTISNTALALGIMGAGVSGNGIYTLGGTGLLTVVNAEEDLGTDTQCTGTFNQSAGTNSLVNSDLRIGNAGSGTYLLSGSGVLSLNTGSEYISGRVKGGGTLNQNGGTNSLATTGHIYVGTNGSYLLSGNGAVVSGGDEYVGSLSTTGGSGTGLFSQTGGMNTIGTLVSPANLNLATLPGTGVAGVYQLSGGSLTVTGNTYLGGASSAQGDIAILSITGGSATVAGSIIIAAIPNCSVNLGGGALSVGSIDDGGNPSHFTWTAGSLTMSNSLSLVANGFLAQSSSLTALKTLTVPGTTTGDGSQQLALTGGTFSTGSISSAGLVQFSSGTFRLTSASLTVGVAGLFGPTLQLGANQHIDIPNGPVTVDPGALIVLTSPSAALSGGTLTNNGTLNGSGQIANNLTNSSSGLVRVSGTDWLRFAGASNTNNGQITLLNGGEADFSGPLTNSATGIISGRGVLGVTGGLTNNGQIQFSGGFGDVFGAVSNNGRITVTGGSTTTFYNAVNTSSGSITVNSNSTAVFLGTLIGIGRVSLIGSGTMDVEGTFSGGAIAGALGSVIIGPSSTGNTDFVDAKSLSVYGSASLTPNGTPAHVSRVNSLLIAGGTLDLANNDLILDYTGASPIAGISSALRAAFANGAWTGGGLTSTQAEAIATDPGNPHKTALGYAEASAFGVTSFDGQSVDPTTVLIRYTANGDANLDGKVNALDFNALATNFGTASAGYWSQGDFNYDGVVNTADFTALAVNFNATALGSPPVLGTLVPEPATIASLVALGALLRRRRA